MPKRTLTAAGHGSLTEPILDGYKAVGKVLPAIRLLMSAIFRRFKGVAMIDLDHVQDGIKELERAARLGLSGAMITEYPLEHRRYDRSDEYEPSWAAAAALDLPLSLHTATRRQGKIRGAGDKTLRDASSRATKAFNPALSMCDLIFSLRASSPPHAGHRRVRAGVGAAPALDDGLHQPRAPRRGDLPVQGPALAKAGDGMLPSDFFPATSC